MTRTRHWSEYTTCVCGVTLRVGSAKEARHRHNFPLLCKPGSKTSQSRVNGSNPELNNPPRSKLFDRLTYHPSDLTIDRDPKP